MTTAIEPAATRPDELGQPNRDHGTTPTEADGTTPRDGSIGHNLPPIPRAARPAVAGGRKRLRSMERSRPAISGAVVAIAVAVLVTVALVFVARSRRRSPAEELLTRLERVPERLHALDV